MKPIQKLLQVMADLRAPNGCPWDREQDHLTLRYHAVEEAYELMDAIEAGDDHEMAEELGDLLLQVVFHCQLARERKAFDFDLVAKRLADKLIRRHPHVFGDAKAKSVADVWKQWDKIKKGEKAGTRHERKSAMDGIPKHLPALMKVEKLVKKAHKAELDDTVVDCGLKPTRTQIARQLFDLAALAQQQGWSAEALLRQETRRRERAWRRMEAKRSGKERQ